MPGNYVRPPSLAATWQVADWLEYRRQILRVKAMPGEEAWFENVGRACLAMADTHLARLASTQVDTESSTAVESSA